MPENWDELEIRYPQTEPEPAGNIELDKADSELFDLDLLKESEFPPEIREKRKSLFRTVKGRVLAMAMAGFITLGGAWKEAYGDQLKIIKKDKGVPEFILESGITDDKLREFEEKLSNEEPEFMEWLENYMKDFLVSLDKFEAEIPAFANTEKYKEGVNRLQETVDSMIEAKKKAGFNPSRETIQYLNDGWRMVAEKNISTLEYFKNNPEELKAADIFFKKHLRTILLSALLLDNSKDVRAKITKNIPPAIRFKPFHTSQLESVAAFVIPIKEEEFGAYTDHDNKDFSRTKFNPEIIITPTAFVGPNEEVDNNYFKNIMIHEIIHAFFTAPEDKQAFFNASHLQSVLWEGITQNRALEIIQYLHTKDRDTVAQLGTPYDDRVVIASILDAVARTGKQEDMLSQWHGMIKSDTDLANYFNETLNNLGLDPTIAEDIAKMNSAVIRAPINSSEDLLTKLLAKLRLTGVRLSPEFIKGILVAGRLWDDKNYSKIDQMTNRWFGWMEARENDLNSK